MTSRLSLIQMELDVLGSFQVEPSTLIISSMQEGMRFHLSTDVKLIVEGEQIDGVLKKKNKFIVRKRIQMSSFLRRMEVGLDVKIGEIEISAEDFINLQPGDSLHFLPSEIFTLTYCGHSIAYGQLKDGVFEVIETLDVSDTINS